MRILLEQVLTPADVTRIRALLAEEAFVDGRATSALLAKHNLQLPQDSGAARAAGALVTQRLLANETFNFAVQPRSIHPPMFSRYEVGMAYPEHVDDAVMGGVRADVALTVFLSERDTYEGGELAIDTGNGERRYRLGAGDVVAYPASTLHRVTPVTRGTRLAAVSWVQSTTRDPARRKILHDLATTVHGLEECPYSARLRRSYCNLVRLWAEV